MTNRKYRKQNYTENLWNYSLSNRAEHEGVFDSR